MFDRVRASWNRTLESWTSRIARAADAMEARQAGKGAPDPEKAASIPVMPNRLLTIAEQRELGLLSNATSQYGPSFDDRCAEADKATEGAPPYITIATFVGGQPGIALIDPRDGTRIADRMVADSKRKYGHSAGFDLPVPRL